MAPTPAQRSLERLAIAVALLLASSCQPEPTAEVPATPSPTPTAAPSPAPSPSPPASPSPTALLAQARDLGTGAVALAQSANTPADWQLVAAQLQRALNLLAAIPADSAESEAAAALEADYKRKLATATTRAEGTPGAAPPTTSPAPKDLRVRVGSNTGATPTPGTAPPAPNPDSVPGFPTSKECQGSLKTTGNPPLQLERLRLYVPTPQDTMLAQDGSTYLVGCVYNQGNQPLTRIGLRYTYVRYTYERGGTPGTGFGELAFPTTPVPAGQIAPFRSVFTLEPQIQTLELVSLDSVYGRDLAATGRARRSN